MAERFSVVSLANPDDRISLVAHDETSSYKPGDHVNVQELPAHGQLQWSASDASSNEKEPSLKRTSYLKSKADATFSKTCTWTHEIIGLLVGASAIAGIVAVLAWFDGKAVPDWPTDITLSAVVALLATLANANLAAPIQSSLSQLKWIRFKTGKAPLTDMEIYDEASRGTWGAIKLIVSLRGGLFGTFGATLAIIALTLGPFTQQIASYRVHMVESPVGASIPRALSYGGYLMGKSSTNGFVPILPMKSAVYNGLFAENGRPSSALNVSCATGNCTFEPFETLAICSKCMDFTPYMSKYCGVDVTLPGASDCGWKVADGSGVLNKSTDVFSMSSIFPSAYGDMPYSTIMKLTFMGTESRAAANIANPWALQCTLSVCVQSINSTVKNGAVNETIVESYLNTTIVDNSNAKTPIPVNITSPVTNETFTMAMGSKLAMESWFSHLFQNGSATRSVTDTNHTITSANNVVVNLTVGVSSGETFFDTDIVTAYYWNYYQFPDGVRLLMDDLAVSMTTAIRSFHVVPHQGLAQSYEAYVHVRWGYIAVPIGVVVLTALFLLATARRTQQSKTKLWKSSALAMLFHGLDSETREQIGNGGSLDEKRKRASKLKVQLDENSEAGSLLRV